MSSPKVHIDDLIYAMLQVRRHGSSAADRKFASEIVSLAEADPWFKPTPEQISQMIDVEAFFYSKEEVEARKLRNSRLALSHDR